LRRKMKTTFKIDRREFDRTMRAYRTFSKRDPETICNTKAFYIVRRATVETQKATKSKIRAELMAPGRLGGPLAALIVNAARAAAGKAGLYGKAMRAAVSALINSRRVASLASGWVAAIKKLEPLADRRGAPRMDRRVKEVGQAKGYARPATGGWVAATVFANLMTAKWDKREGAGTIATPALQRAFEAEERSMRDYIERKLRETALRAGVRTN
jgi:hypothetical protein